MRERYPYPNPYRIHPCEYGRPEARTGGGIWMPDSVWDREEKRDLEYWEQLYPAQTRRLQREVTRQCDQVDYSGSFIYDEYPDRIALARLCEAVYRAYREAEEKNQMGEYPVGMPQQDEEEAEEAYDFSGSGAAQAMSLGRRRRADQAADQRIRNLIEALVYSELHRRRSAGRRRAVSFPMWR